LASRSPSNLINAVKTSDTIDVVLASISASMSRLGLIYSCSYAVARRGYIIKSTAGSLFDTISSENDLNVAGLRVAAVSGTLGLAWAQQALTNVELIIAPSNPVMYEMLSNNTVQAIVRFEPWNSFWVANQTDASSYKTGVSSTNELLFSAWHTRYDTCSSSASRAIGVGNQGTQSCPSYTSFASLIVSISPFQSLLTRSTLVRIHFLTYSNTQSLRNLSCIALNNIRVTNAGFYSAVYARHNATTPSHTFTCAATSSNITTWPVPTNGGSLAQVINSGVLRAGRFFPNAPFNYLEGLSTSSVGVDADIAYEVARALSVAYSKSISIQWVDVSSGDLFNTATNLYNNNVRL
jgi:ABC-type amino acid transport substrate-binding protein